MQQQPLAFTLVKTIVSARDEGRVLSPALATAWDLLRTELSPAHRVIASEVSWAPTHQEDLKFVIEGVRRQFEKDPELENEFLAFLAEVEPYRNRDNEATIFPILGVTAGGSEIPQTIGEIAIDIESKELNADVEINPAEDHQPDELLKADEVNEVPHIEHEPIELETAHTPSESFQFADLDSPLEESDTPDIRVEEQTLAEDTVADESTVESKIQDVVVEPPVSTSMHKSSGSMLSYWPVGAIALLIALVTFGVWMFSGQNPPPSIPDQLDPVFIPSSVLPEDPVAVITESEPTPEYAEPNIARLSKTVDSLRQSGDYAGALKKQQELAQLLDKERASDKEKAQAFSELAILYAGQNNVLQAVVEQRKSLNFARQAFAKTDPALGRSHLKLASFYTDSGELHMARAHLQQARKIFGQAQELVKATDLEQSEKVAEKILKAS
jgi:hypothetical protein